MCDQRERLIGFVYDDCDPDEQRDIERHVAGCDICQREITTLRSVRQDLLAWDVPAHEPVWRPLVPAPIVSSWRQIPIWSLAAAASVMFAVGAAGGVATHLVLSRGAAGPTQAAAVPAPSPATLTPVVERTAVSPTDLAALEARLAERVRDAERRVQLVSLQIGQRRAGDAPAGSPTYADLMREVRELRDQQKAYYNLNLQMVNDYADLTQRTKAIEKVGFSMTSTGK